MIPKMPLSQIRQYLRWNTMRNCRAPVLTKIFGIIADNYLHIECHYNVFAYRLLIYLQTILLFSNYFQPRQLLQHSEIGPLKTFSSKPKYLKM